MSFTKRTYRIGPTLRSCVAIVLGLVWTFFWSGLGLLGSFVFRKREFGTFIMKNWGRGVLWLFGIRVQVKGAENFLDQGCLYVFNHGSLFDIPVLQATLPGHVRFGSKIELFKIPVFGGAMRRLGVLPIVRHQRDQVLQLYKESISRVKEGESFVLAPEGTRQLRPELGAFKAGPFVFAIHGELPIVPCVLLGVFEVIPKTAWIPNPDCWKKNVEVHILPAVSSQGYTMQMRTELQNAVREKMLPVFAAPQSTILFALTWILAGLVSLGGAQSLQASPLGSIELNQWVLQPQVELQERQTGEFFLRDSFLQFEFSANENLRGRVKMGSGDMMTPSQLYREDVDARLGLAEAYVEFAHDLVRVRAGQIPLPFGIEFFEDESSRLLPLSLLYRKRLLTRRDFGVSVSSESRGFSSEFYGYNGESGPNLDGRVWIGGVWSYRNPLLQILLSGQAGATKPASTAESGSTLAQANLREKALWRWGAFGFKIEPKYWEISGEIGSGESIQNEVRKPFYFGHGDLLYQTSSNVWVGLRWDHWEPNDLTQVASEREASSVLVWRNENQTNQVTLALTKVWEKGMNIANDRILLAWKLVAAPEN